MYNKQILNKIEFVYIMTKNYIFWTCIEKLIFFLNSYLNTKDSERSMKHCTWFHLFNCFLRYSKHHENSFLFKLFITDFSEKSCLIISTCNKSNNTIVTIAVMSTWVILIPINANKCNMDHMSMREMLDQLCLTSFKKKMYNFFNTEPSHLPYSSWTSE